VLGPPRGPGRSYSSWSRGRRTKRCGWSPRPSGSEDEEVRVVTETAEVGIQAGNQIGEECQEMVAALRAHNASIQLQVDAQEWMGHQVEHLVQAMDLQRTWRKSWPPPCCD